MHINFQQGIIFYPNTSGQQMFLAKTGSYVSLQTQNGRTDIAFAYKTENYLVTEVSDVQNAWGPLLQSTDYWLYWDINLRTAVRTFGFTAVAPMFGMVQPTGIEGLHWFDTNNTTMYCYTSGNWREVVRVFAAKVNNSTFVGLGATSIGGYSFAGTQVNVFVPDVAVGRILIDDVGDPIRRLNGTFITTEDELFINGSPVNAIRLESSVVTATANENIARYQIVKYTDFGQINLAQYNDIQSTIIAISMEDIIAGNVGVVCVQGVITNPQWNFQTVGAPLWVSGIGLLSEQDSHITDVLNCPVEKTPIARVLTPYSIFFDQGLGGVGGVSGVGEQGIQGATGPAGADGSTGPQGATGPAGLSFVYWEHDQTTPIAVWTVVHNLGRIPAITVIDSGGNSVWGDYTYPDLNTTTLTFSAAFSGTAYFR